VALGHSRYTDAITQAVNETFKCDFINDLGLNAVVPAGEAEADLENDCSKKTEDLLGSIQSKVQRINNSSMTQRMRRNFNTLMSGASIVDVTFNAQNKTRFVNALNRTFAVQRARQYWEIHEFCRVLGEDIDSLPLSKIKQNHMATLRTLQDLSSACCLLTNPDAKRGNGIAEWADIVQRANDLQDAVKHTSVQATNIVPAAVHASEPAASEAKPNGTTAAITVYRTVTHAVVGARKKARNVAKRAAELILEVDVPAAQEAMLAAVMASS
jgi:hypothetical protein